MHCFTAISSIINIYIFFFNVINIQQKIISGGTASNLVSLIAKADVALSVLLTSCSTLLASIATPLLVKYLVGSTIAISGWTLCTATARVVLLPVLLGMLVNDRIPKLAERISRFTPFASAVLVALIW